MERGAGVKRAGGWIVAVGLLAAACKHASPLPEVPAQLEGREIFTCCNIHYQNEDVSDANYWVGATLPAGTQVKIEKIDRDSATFRAGEVRLTLTHQYGTDEESLQQYLDKVLTKTDPRPRLAVYSSAVRRAIAHSKVERGMTRDQVIASLGYPPTHQTKSTREREWTYWYNRWVTFKVVFDESGKVADIVGHPAPTAEVPITNADAPAKPAQSKKGKKK
jgi:hypothetical protein